jgi:FkbM family methyltransferase
MMRSESPSLGTTIHEELVERFATFFSRMPSSIYELGSRDGEDAARLSAAAPHAQVVAFECNPDTVAAVQRRLADVPNARAMDLAVTDFDGSATFYKIDPQRTVTTWEDGNPGASSLYVATGNYPVEEYVQTPVNVRAARLDTLIDADTIPPPEMLWIDLQGAELAALRGLGAHLGQVGLVYVELSFLDIYEGQPLAKEVIGFLRSAGFTIAAVPWKGEFQCEVVFVNLRLLGPSARSRASAQGLSLERTLGSPGKSGSPRSD